MKKKIIKKKKKSKFGIIDIAYRATDHIIYELDGTQTHIESQTIAFGNIKDAKKLYKNLKALSRVSNIIRYREEEV